MALVQHARLMSEYAAFSAARAGAVWNADPTTMMNAAEMALVPTFGIATENAGPGAQPGRRQGHRSTSDVGDGRGSKPRQQGRACQHEDRSPFIWRPEAKPMDLAASHHVSPRPSSSIIRAA